MFGKITTFSSLLFAAIAVAAYYSFALLDPTALPEYKKLVRESLELRSKPALEREPAHQCRKEVQKDIWTFNGNQRLHYRLKSRGSELKIVQTKGKIDLKEHLENIECCMQEEIDRDTQQIRYIFAPEGTYLFPSHRFTADEADLYFFSLPGSELPIFWPTETPFLQGTASEVVFSASAGLPSFTAYHLNAEIDRGNQ